MKTRSRFILLLLFLVLAGCNRRISETGRASYYADTFNGRKTASGAVFSQHKRTAAHPSLPFGTKVTVTNQKNGRKVKVRINDRGPFVAGRIIDLSKKSAKKIGMLKDGVVPVTITYKKSGHQ